MRRVSNRTTEVVCLSCQIAFDSKPTSPFKKQTAMKKPALFFWSVLFFSWVCIAWGPHGSQVHPSTNASLNKPTTPQRASITFILGEDDDLANPYFSMAAAYYRSHPEDATDTVITDLRSLLAVRNFLEAHAPTNGLAWGTINLVVHSNEWTGLSAPVLPHQKRTTEASLRHAIASGDLPTLPASVLDTESQLIFWGCGLGYNGELLQLLAESFGEAAVYSPNSFVQYRLDSYGQPQRYLNRCYFVTYPRGYHPGNWQLARELDQAYPERQLNWAQALDTPAPAPPHTPYSYSFHIPVKWIVTYPSNADRPPVKAKSDQQAWLNQQPELLAAVERQQMAMADFTWTIYPTQYTFADGVTEPAIKAIGLCTIVCVLEPIGDPEAGLGSAFYPLRPALEDSQYFACY